MATRRPLSTRGRHNSTGDNPIGSKIVTRYISTPGRTSKIEIPMPGFEGNYPASSLTKKNLQPGDQGKHVLGKGNY